MEEQQIETSNINFKWLENIYEQLKNIQDMERLAREGCNSLNEYLQIPFEMQKVLIPDMQYKNLKFFYLELEMLVNNLSPILKDKTSNYIERIGSIGEVIDTRNLFLKEIVRDNQLQEIKVVPFFNTTLRFMSRVKADLIKDIGFLLYIEDEEKKKTW